MSNRTIVELNHDYCPRDDAQELIEWALRMRYYMGCADPAYLPSGVTFLHYRHHSEPRPLEPQKRGRDREPHFPAWCKQHAEQLIAKAKAAGDAGLPEPRRGDTHNPASIRAAALEEAAKVADIYVKGAGTANRLQRAVASSIAAAIRALGEK
jgi:hypothetical protein